MNIFKKVKDHIKYNPSCLRNLFPQSKQKGSEVYFDEPSYNSWSYNIYKGFGKDFRTNESQDIIEIYRILNNLPKSIEAAKQMASQLGIPTDMQVIKHIEIRDIGTIQSRDKLRLIRKIWCEAEPMEGTIGMKYLESRGIALPISAMGSGRSLRYHPNLYHGATKKTHPAIVAALYDKNNKLSAIHRHYLNEEGGKLFPKGSEHAGKNKLLLGDAKGFYVDLDVEGSAGQILAICEGVETGLALLTSLSSMKNIVVWCALSAGNMPNIEVPNSIFECIEIYTDIESKAVGIKAAIKLKAKCDAKSHATRIIISNIPINRSSDASTEEKKMVLKQELEAELKEEEDREAEAKKHPLVKAMMTRRY